MNDTGQGKAATPVSCATCNDGGTVYTRRGDDSWDPEDCPNCARPQRRRVMQLVKFTVGAAWSPMYDDFQQACDEASADHTYVTERVFDLVDSTRIADYSTLDNTDSPVSP